MSTGLVIELVGYGASTLIIISIIQKSILRLRLVGLAGSLAFFAYALLIGAYPIAVVNVIAAGIHIWFLRKLIGRKNEVFRILHVLPESRYLLNFLEFYADEIQGRYQPDFVYEPSPDLVTAFILRDMVPAGVLIGRVQADGSFKVDLDFVIPQYRDFKIGHYVYSPDSALLTGIAPTVVWTDAANDDHAQYLKRIGFSACTDQSGRYEIHVTEPVGDHAAPSITPLGRGEQTL
ncbi:MAG: hypothetical protein GXP35_02065 [Actinobacteria bacterium]|nr:hypothetical protein [Actinomycetota bacterium]